MVELAAPAVSTNNDDLDKTDLNQIHKSKEEGNQDPNPQGANVDTEKRVPEEALETHEVVEINKFTMRRKWIEEKTQLLEGMPPIEVFAGVETLTSLLEEIPPGVPTRAELNRWLEEHDTIEKETEIFDAGDMNKLKKLTKAATKRNLSPEDTDLIELTLTTLLALDKLLHLLRDRSEMLDLLGLRLTWEEQRVAAWRERRSLLEDLKAFLTSRARWSLDTYELPPPSTSSPALKYSSPSSSPLSSPLPSRRRDSAASLASISSDTSTSTTSPPSVYSRSTRYRLAELLSHDAALFSSRLIALNHGKITPAGKTLDKLIDASRKPVPDEILDEQDRLEDRGVKEIETVGKFALTVVMQWKRADEHYSDTKKDLAAAQALIVDLNKAKLQHPTARHDSTFMSRAQALTKRLAVKGDPTLPRSSFPRPVHPLFPDQGASNEAIIKTLSTELVEAVKLAQQAEALALSYRADLEAVTQAETSKEQMRELDEQFRCLMGKLVKGVHDEHAHGDGSPPDLEKESCLDPMRHATFLALLPSMLQELEQTDRTAERALSEGRVVLLRIKELQGVDPTLQQAVEGMIRSLEMRRDEARRVKVDLLARTQRLREVRRLWGILSDIRVVIEGERKLAVDDMERKRWKPQERPSDALLTPDPESPEFNRTSPPVALALDDILQRLDGLEQRLSTEFNQPLASLSVTLEKQLHDHLKSNSYYLSNSIHEIKGLARLWDRILRQAREMVAVQRDANELENKINLLQASIDFARQDVLDTNQTPDEVMALTAYFRSQADVLQDSIQSFTDALVTRVPFVSYTDKAQSTDPRPISGFNSTSVLTTSASSHPRESFVEMLPFNLSTLDNEVRTEANTLTLRLAGGMQFVDKKLDYLQLSRLARLADAAFDVMVENVEQSERTLSAMKTAFETIEQASTPSELGSSRYESLTVAKESLDRAAQERHARMSICSSSVQGTIEALQGAAGAHDSPIHGTIIIPRVKIADSFSRRVDMINEEHSKLRDRVVELERAESERVRVEKERLAEQARLEKERQAERKARQEIERLQAEERARLERERLESEERARLEEARRLEEERSKAKGNKLLEQRSIKEHAQIDQAHTEAERFRRGHTMKGDKDQQGEIAFQKSRTPDEDVFGLREIPSTSAKPFSRETTSLRARILSLQNRLQSLNLSNLARTPSTVQDAHTIALLPTSQDASDLHDKFSAVVSDAATLPLSVPEDAIVDSELKSLRSRLDASDTLVRRLIQLGKFSDNITACDHVVSDLLEHADSYPAAPSPHNLTSSHVSDTRLACEDQLRNRLAFTKHVVDEMSEAATALADDARVIMEQHRVEQTWSELVDMCMDRLDGARSRPASSVSSTGRNSINTSASVSSGHQKAKPSLNGYGQPATRPSKSSNRRTTSGTHDPVNRPSSHMSHRSISGPSGFSSLFNSTFASRQRTTSLASIPSGTATPIKRPMSPITRPRTTSRRPGSPTFSETSTHSFASTPSRSTWSRAPRQSFGAASRDFQVSDNIHKRKAYVANPKSKLDMAVGHVVNNFKIPVTVQAASDEWKDQSGKYWIGDEEPKLCFCRILRSRTVMVRVGGGWCELSKFLRGHFADLLADLPPSPPKKEERWISSATLLETPEPPMPSLAIRGSTTPEPKGTGLLPSFQLLTPSGTSPQSLKTSSSPGGSPGLTPFQFMRRAEPGIRSPSPSPAKNTRLKPTTPAATPSRTNIWRP